MNQQMQELYNQSMTAHRIENRPGDVFTKSFRAELDANKFAELIVKECAEIADVERPNSIGCGYITKTKGMLIREHFGVEE